MIKSAINRIGIQIGESTQSQPMFMSLVNLKNAKQAVIKIRNPAQPLIDIFCNGILKRCFVKWNI